MPGLLPLLRPTARVPGLRSIRGMGGYYAARLESAYADTNLVGSLTDFSGKGRTGSQSGTARPTFRTNQINGLPAFSLDGVDDCFKVDGLATLFNNFAPFTLMFVAKLADNTNAYEYFSAGSSISNNQFTALDSRAAAAGDRGQINNDAAVGILGTTTTAAGTGANIYTVIATGGTFTLRRNGIIIINAAVYTPSGTQTFDRFTIGALGRTSYSTFFKGLFAELGAWFRVLAAGEYTFGERVLGRLYGVAIP